VKMTQIVKVALNGDADQVDKAVRRTLYAVANEYDEQSQAFLDEVRGVKKLLLTLTGSVVTGILLIVAQILLQL